MAANPTSQSNMALSHLGHGKEIQNVMADVSSEASACRVFLDMSFLKTLRDFHWPVAKKVAALVLVEENPSGGWGFAYRTPSDCVKVRFVDTDGAWAPGYVNKKSAPFDVGSDNGGGLIYSNIRDAVVEYTREISNYSLMPPDFLLAHSFLLAHYIAPRVTKGDPFKLGNRAYQLYDMEIRKAAGNANNEAKPQTESVPDLVKARV